MVYKLKKTSQFKSSLKLAKKGVWECHIKPDWLLLYYKDEDVLTLTLVDTGSHSDIFNN